MEIFGIEFDLANLIVKRRFRGQLFASTLYDVMFGNGRSHLIPEKPWLYLYDGKNTFKLETEVHGVTTAELYKTIAKGYGMKLNPRHHLRVVFTDKELKFSNKSHLSDYDVINHSTVGVIFLLPDSPRLLDRAPAVDSECECRMRLREDGDSETEQRTELSQRPRLVPITNMLPDFADFELRPDLFRAIMPCFHVMGSATMRDYVSHVIANGGTSIPCPYILLPFSPLSCPAVWDYRFVRHVACFTTEEMHITERNLTTNYIGKDPNVLNCPRCYAWCARYDPTISRIWCFVCSGRTGLDFLFCGYCSNEWRNTAAGGGCGNDGCNSVEARLEILRNSPVTQLYGGTWPTIRACPNCGIITEFLGQCSQMQCRLCRYCYCFLCLKGAKSKRELKCVPYDSDCQRAPLQTTIPEWNGHVITS